MTAQNPVLGHNPDLSAVSHRSAQSDTRALLAAATPVLASTESPIRQSFAEWLRLERVTYGVATLPPEAFRAAVDAIADLEEQIRRQRPTNLEDVALMVVVLTCFGEYCLPPDLHDKLAELMASRMPASSISV